MLTAENRRLAGYAFIAIGIGFIVSTLLGHQSVNVALGAAFLAVGAALLRKAKRSE